jgi:uncharacterized protein YecE (DUF72 family)
MSIRAGTSGFSYKEWKGSFYPEDLPASKMLSWYSGRLPAVEINNTFYRMPKPEVLDSWAGQVGSDFRFVLKASRRITHFKRLKDVDEEVGFFLRSASILGEQLGAVLFQLPPNFPKDMDKLRAFLDLIGQPEKTAFEFRHASWQDQDVLDCLAGHGAALCVADTESTEGTIVRTGTLGYLRLRRPNYEPDELSKWASAVAEAGWSETFVFFKHEDEGAGPQMAEEFQRLVTPA